LSTRNEVLENVGRSSTQHEKVPANLFAMHFVQNDPELAGKAACNVVLFCYHLPGNITESEVLVNDHKNSDSFERF
jgi:hypothetical protein